MTRTEYIQPGDTIIRLAQRHLGNSNRWRELATLNRLRYPYVADDAASWVAAGARVLGPGDAILIPTQADARPLTQAQAEDRAYGIDVGWNDANFDVIREGARLGLDRGIRNLAKALYRRLITYPGELPAHPAYGCRIRDHLGQPASAWRSRLAALDVQEAMLRDPRVVAADVTAEYLGSGELRVSAAVTPIPPSESFTLAVTIGAGGARAELDL